MKKTFSRFQIAYIHVILLLLIMLSGWCVIYHKPDAERIISWICAEKPIFLLFSLQIRLFPSCLLKYVIKIGESALFPIAKKEKGQGR